MFKIELDPIHDKDYINNLLEYNNAYMYEGTLLDNYILDGDSIQYKDIKGDYGILLETYKNCWSSSYTLIITDNVAIYNKYYDIHLRDLELEDIIYDIEHDNTLTKLQEVGRIYLHEIEYSIDLFIEALSSYTGDRYIVVNNIDGQYIIKMED